MLRNADGGGGVKFSRKMHYDGVKFNVISVTRGWVGSLFPGKKRYVALECPPSPLCSVKADVMEKRLSGRKCTAKLHGAECHQLRPFPDLGSAHQVFNPRFPVFCFHLYSFLHVFSYNITPPQFLFFLSFGVNPLPCSHYYIFSSLSLHMA